MWIIKKYQAWNAKKAADEYVSFVYRGWGHKTHFDWTTKRADAHEWTEKSGAFKWIKRRPDLKLSGGSYTYMTPEAEPGRVLVVVSEVAAVPAPAARSAKPKRKPAPRRPRKTPRPAARKKGKRLTRKRR